MFLATGGLVGQMPDYYSIVRAAREIGVEPVVLASGPNFQINWILNSVAGEVEGQKQYSEAMRQKEESRNRR